MQVKQLMTSRPDTIDINATLMDAAIEMKKNDFGFLPIENNGKPVGVITDRDLVIRAISAGKDPSETKVKDVMTKDLFTCNDEDDLAEAVKKMSENQIHRLLVLNKKREMIGVLSLGDIARKGKDTSLSGKAVESILKE